MRKIKRAFTLLELVFVIIVFGIVSAIVSEVISKVYENYIYTRTVNALQTKSELALEQIANRLQYRIKNATIAAKPNTSTTTAQFISTADPNLDDSYTVLEWIGYDMEGFKGVFDDAIDYHRPIWSGLIDIDASTQTQLLTPGSQLSNLDAIISSLSNNEADGSDAVLIFPPDSLGFDISLYGWYGNDSNYTYDFQITDDTTIDINDTAPPQIIYERYKLAWTAYAIAPSPLECTQDCNLTLYWNYQPWQGETFQDATSTSTLVENVSVFKFRQDGDVMRIKLCVKDRAVEQNISICKEKVVF